MKATCIFTLTSFITIALKVIGVSAGFPQRYGNYYSQYAPQAYQQPYTRYPSNGFFQNSAINRHFQNLRNRQDYQPNNRNRYSAMLPDRREQHGERIPLELNQVTTQNIINQQNEEPQNPSFSTPVTTPDKDIPNINKSEDSVINTSDHQQLIKKPKNQEENKQILNQENDVVTLQEEVSLTPPDANESQSRRKREFNPESNDSEEHYTEVKKVETYDKVSNSEEKTLTEKNELKYEGEVKGKYETQTTNETESIFAPRTEFKSNKIEKEEISINENETASFSEEKQLESDLSQTNKPDSVQKTKQQVQQKSETDFEGQNNTNQLIGIRKIHKVTKEVIKKNRLIDILEDIFNVQDNVSSKLLKQQFELNKTFKEARNHLDDDPYVNKNINNQENSISKKTKENRQQVNQTETDSEKLKTNSTNNVYIHQKGDEEYSYDDDLYNNDKDTFYYTSTRTSDQLLTGSTPHSVQPSNALSNHSNSEQSLKPTLTTSLVPNQLFNDQTTQLTEDPLEFKKIPMEHYSVDQPSTDTTETITISENQHSTEKYSESNQREPIEYTAEMLAFTTTQYTEPLSEQSSTEYTKTLGAIDDFSQTDLYSSESSQTKSILGTQSSKEQVLIASTHPMSQLPNDKSIELTDTTYIIYDEPNETRQTTPVLVQRSSNEQQFTDLVNSSTIKAENQLSTDQPSSEVEWTTIANTDQFQDSNKQSGQAADSTQYKNETDVYLSTTNNYPTLNEPTTTKSQELETQPISNYIDATTEPTQSNDTSLVKHSTEAEPFTEETIKYESSSGQPDQPENETEQFTKTTETTTSKPFQKSKQQDSQQLLQKDITSTPFNNELERRGRYDLSKTSNIQEIHKAVETDINFKTFIVPDKAKPGGRCYCSCDMNARPIFLSLDASQFP